MKIFRKIYNHILSSKKSISKEDQWRERGVRIGKNFDAPDSVIDYCFGFLVTIGDNVTLSGTTVLAHDGSTKKILAINEQISNFAQTYPTNLKASSNEALLFMRRYRFANCSCFSCCFKDAYPSSNVQ